MGDSGEGLVDSEARIQERMDQLQADRENSRKPRVVNSERNRKIESLRLARIQMERQLETASSPARKNQIRRAVEDLDLQLKQLQTD